MSMEDLWLRQFFHGWVLFLGIKSVYTTKSERNYRGKCLGWPVTSYGGDVVYILQSIDRLNLSDQIFSANVKFLSCELSSPSLEMWCKGRDYFWVLQHQNPCLLRWFLRNKSCWWISLKLSLKVLYQALFRKKKNNKTIGHHSRLRDVTGLWPPQRPPPQSAPPSVPPSPPPSPPQPSFAAARCFRADAAILNS